MLSEEVKVSVQLMIQTYGGRFTKHMTRKNTHLVLPHAFGDKYEHALKWDVKPVTIAWLVDSCYAGAPVQLSRWLLPESWLYSASPLPAA